MNRVFKLALVQMLVEGGNKEANLGRALSRIREAAVLGAKVIVLPEAMPLGWTHSSAAREAEAIPDGPACAMLGEAARENQVYICSGLVEKSADKIFNAAVLIDPGGRVVLHHRKLNELEIAHHCYEQGDRLQVAQTSLGKIGIMICSDAFVRGQVVSRTLGLMGADMILSPCAWAVPCHHDPEKDPYGQLWLDNYQPVARDFRIWIVGVSNVGWITDGPWEGWKCIGCSLVVGPSGEQVAMAGYGVGAEAMVYVDVELQPRPARGCAWEKVWADDQLM